MANCINGIETADNQQENITICQTNHVVEMEKDIEFVR